jgi:hypothetical protein
MDSAGVKFEQMKDISTILANNDIVNQLFTERCARSLYDCP